MIRAYLLLLLSLNAFNGFSNNNIVEKDRIPTSSEVFLENMFTDSLDLLDSEALPIKLEGFPSSHDFLIVQDDTTNLSTLSSKSFSFKTKAKYSIPAALIVYGFIALDDNIFKKADTQIHHEIQENYPTFSTQIDDKLQYAPVATVYALNILGVKSKNNLFDRTAMYLISNSLMSMSVDFLKGKTAKLRPSGSDRRSFPSGHTATAFVAAEFMNQEFKNTSPWYGYIGYSMATATGALRMMNNQHWLSDVLAGAGVGILTTKFTYLAYPWIKKKIIGNKHLNFMATPVIQNGNVGFSLIAPL
ncbi:MAG: phosphatase PAP2 family protein [Bacteroidota bacterium]